MKKTLLIVISDDQEGTLDECTTTEAFVTALRNGMKDLYFTVHSVAEVLDSYSATNNQ